MRMLSHRFLAYLLAACSLIGLTTPPIVRAEAPRDSRVELIVGKSFAAQDTLATGHEAELDARNCLQGLVWEPNKFEVTLQVRALPMHAEHVMQ
ncbi:MAG: hypothetical protein IT422_27295 [Pirellulaceae bacterium]|nr:hypothetical protein [Pirellulaceae bacterium]